MFMFLNFVLQHIWPLFNVSFLAVVTGGAAATDQYIFTCTVHGPLLGEIDLIISPFKGLL